jgi:hypothetical protein
MMRYLFLAQKAANIFLAGLAILVCASCLLAPTPTNAPIPKSFSNAELTSSFTVTPVSFPDEESTSTSLPGEPLAIVSSATQTFSTATPDSSPYDESTPTSLPGVVPDPVSSATQTFPTATHTNTPTSDLGWLSHYIGDKKIAFRYPEHWNVYYSHSWDGEYFVCVYAPDNDIGFNFHYPYSEDDPGEDYTTHRLAQWAEDGMELNWLTSFKPETVVDGGNIVIAGNHSSSLTAQGNVFTVQATYLKPKQTGKVMGLIWYATSDQWDAMGEIFSEMLASITFAGFSYTHYGSEIRILIPDDWLSPIGHPNRKGTWFQSPDQKIGMLIGMMPQGDPSMLLADWTPGKLTSLGFSNCSVPIPGDQMEAEDIMADSMQGNCLDDSGVEVTYEMTYVKLGENILEVVTYFPTMQSEHASLFLSLMFRSIQEVGSTPEAGSSSPKQHPPCEGDIPSSECNPG